MKEWIIIVLILTVILWIVLFPKQETYTFVNQKALPVVGYKIELDGEIEKPGVYTIYEPMRLEEIIVFAYGLTKQADLEEVELSKVYDQDSYIYIPSIDEEDIIADVKININEANFQMLLTIPGIQERQAASIVVYREANGLFGSLDELINVNYIGPKTLEKIRPYLTY